MALSPIQEKDLFLKVNDKMKKEGDLWYVRSQLLLCAPDGSAPLLLRRYLLAKPWWAQWKGYVGLLNHEGEKVKRSGKPGPIDNKALQLKKNVLVPDLVGAANDAFHKGLCSLECFRSLLTRITSS